MYRQKVISENPRLKSYFLLASEKPLTNRAGSGTLVSGMDPWIRIRTKMSRIYNASHNNIMTVKIYNRIFCLCDAYYA
jgi:hypothetical protein